MQVKLEETDKNNEVKLEITVDSQKFIETMNHIFKQSAKYFNIPGFRKGKAPMNIVEKYYGANIFYEDAFNEIFDETYIEAVKEKNLEVVTRPFAEIVQMEKGKDLIYTVVVGVKPEVKLGKYKGLEIENIEHKVTDEEVEKEISEVQEKNARLITIDNRPVESGDTVIIDFEGFVDGNTFEGGKAENYELVIGSNTFIAGFEEQIIGMKIDEEKDINVKFPDDYFSKDLCGKDAVFKVVLHEIRTKELPKLDDDFAKDVSEFDTFAEYKQSIRFKKEEQADSETKSLMEEAVVQKACENSDVEITEKMVELELDNMLTDLDKRLSYQGMSMDQYLKILGKTTDDFRNENKESARNAIKVRLVLEAICEDSKIEADDSEINEKISELVKQFNRTEEELRKNQELMENIKATIKNDKAIKLLLDNAKKVAKKENKKEEKKEDKKANKAEPKEDVSENKENKSENKKD